MATVDTETLRATVRETYGRIASGAKPAGCCGGVGCCSPMAAPTSEDIGYSSEERQSVPAGADLGLGCGNPQAIAGLREGERVLDLGSGAGFDAFLAARRVGSTGFVIGVDMTAEMVIKARANVLKTDIENVEFRLGEIEYLPLADSNVNVIMSNCVINLSTDKPAVFREAFRVLVPGGRLAISDIVAIADIPGSIRNDPEAYAGCVAGAAHVSDVVRMLTDAGFEDVVVDVRQEGRDLAQETERDLHVRDFVASALIRARKPAAQPEPRLT
jgi:arsenite methyltransferase